MQASYQLNKPEKSNHHVPSSYRLISPSNIFGKIFERVLLQEAVNTLTENNFSLKEKCICIPENQKCSPNPTSTYRADV